MHYGWERAVFPARSNSDSCMSLARWALLTNFKQKQKFTPGSIEITIFFSTFLHYTYITIFLCVFCGPKCFYTLDMDIFKYSFFSATILIKIFYLFLKKSQSKYKGINFFSLSSPWKLFCQYDVHPPLLEAAAILYFTLAGGNNTNLFRTP